MVNINNMKTKDRILVISLEKFSTKGFEGVSIRDIASEVGVRESALYRHYKNKQDIFDSIVSLFCDQMDQESENIRINVNKKSFSNEKDRLFWTMDALLEMILHNDDFNKFRTMLQIEKYSNPVAAQSYQRCILDNTRDLVSERIQECAKAGLFQEQEVAVITDVFSSLVLHSVLRHEAERNPYRQASPYLKEVSSQLFNSLQSNRTKRTSMFGFF